MSSLASGGIFGVDGVSEGIAEVAGVGGTLGVPAGSPVAQAANNMLDDRATIVAAVHALRMVIRVRRCRYLHRCSSVA
jgi:hypothetical protein